MPEQRQRTTKMVQSPVASPQLAMLMPIQLARDTVTYNVTDAAGNAATQVTRTINVGPDETIPVISLIGSSSVDVERANAYSDLGATATDNADGTITSSIVTVNGVDATTSGTYTVTYDVNDAAGNAATQVTRVVTVEDTTPPGLTVDSLNLNVADGTTALGFGFCK